MSRESPLLGKKAIFHPQEEEWKNGDIGIHRPITWNQKCLNYWYNNIGASLKKKMLKEPDTMNNIFSMSMKSEKKQNRPGVGKNENAVYLGGGVTWLGTSWGSCLTGSSVSGQSFGSTGAWLCRPHTGVLQLARYISPRKSQKKSHQKYQ